jgi:hypothetical protein
VIEDVEERRVLRATKNIGALFDNIGGKKHHDIAIAKS